MRLDNKVPVITIDGPSGTGKGTVCHKLAEWLGWHILDSGCIYRVLAFAAEKKGVDLQDTQKLVHLAQNLNLRFETSEYFKTRIFLEGTDVYEDIRSENCGQNASKIAVIPEVRAALLEKQRAFAQSPGLVTDGRDMGTVVFPDADLKIYLDASAEIRAKRRYYELKDKEINVSLAAVVDELEKRDARDSKRLHAPLKPASDAVILDTSELTIVQVFDNVIKLIKEHTSFKCNVVGG